MLGSGEEPLISAEMPGAGAHWCRGGLGEGGLDLWGTGMEGDHGDVRLQGREGGALGSAW